MLGQGLLLGADPHLDHLLEGRLPGLIVQDEGIVLEPDEQARGVVQLVLDKFEELGSVNGILRCFRREGIRLGIRAVRSPDRGQLTWRVPSRTTLLGILHHPVYAGAYVYGRRKSDPSRRVAGKRGSGRRWATPDQWEVLIHDALPAYITWQQWAKNQAKLKENSTKYGRGAPRGASLLAGRVVCGRCGNHMSISYAERNNARLTCDAARWQKGDPQCQSLRARPLEMLVVEQISGLIARRIECWRKPGDTVATGEKYGIIYFGSQAAVHFPNGSKCTVKAGDRVAGGLTPIGEWTSNS